MHVRGTVFLNAPATTGGAVVGISARIVRAGPGTQPPVSEVAELPESVTVPAGRQQGEFTITTRRVQAETVLGVTAHYEGQERTARVTILPVAREPLPDGTVIKGSGPETYLIEGGLKRLFPDRETFAALGYTDADVRTIPDEDLARVPT